MEQTKLSNIFENLEVFNNMYMNFVDKNEDSYNYLSKLFSSKTCEKNFSKFLEDLLDNVIGLNQACILEYSEKELKIILNGIENHLPLIIEKLSTKENKKLFYAWIGNLNQYERELLNVPTRKLPPVYHQGKETYPFGTVITFKTIEDLEKVLKVIGKSGVVFQYRFAFSNLLFIREKTQLKLDKILDKLGNILAMTTINPTKFEKLPQ